MYDVILVTDMAIKRGVGRYAAAYKLASDLRKHGFSVFVVDCFSSFTDSEAQLLFNKIVGNNTLMVGFSMTFLENFIDIQGEMYEPINATLMLNKNKVPMIRNTFGVSDKSISAVIDICKQKSPNIKFAVGGWYSPNKLFSSFPFIDYGFIGMAERSFREVCVSLREKKPTPPFNVVSGKKVFHQDMYMYDDFPTSTIEWAESDTMFFQERSIPIEIARGCIFNCSYCNYQMKNKKRSSYIKQAETLKTELVYNYDRYGITNYTFCDYTFNDDIDKVLSVHDVIMSLPFKITFDAYLRLDIFKKYPQMRELLLEMGLNSTLFGIETLNKDIGKQVGKGLGTEALQLLEFLNKSWHGKIHTVAGMVLGLYGESIQSIKTGIKEVGELTNAVACTPLLIFRSDQKGINNQNITYPGYTVMDFEHDVSLTAPVQYWKTDAYDVYDMCDIQQEAVQAHPLWYMWGNKSYLNRYSNTPSYRNISAKDTVYPVNMQQIFIDTYNKKRSYVELLLSTIS